jgi:hypothetical protein
MNVTLTTTGKLWHFHAIGTGLIFSYNTTSKEVLVLSEDTGCLINLTDCKEYPFETKEEFKEFCLVEYKRIIEEEPITLSIIYMDNPTIIGDYGIAIDLELAKN